MTKKKDIFKALEQTVSDEQFNKQAMVDLAATLSDDEAIAKQAATDVESILLDTLAEPAPSDADGDDQGHAVRLTDRKFSHEQEALDKNTVEGRYHIGSLLGSGAAGQVFSVRDNNFDRDIAVKFLHPKFATNEKKMLQFLNEARITARLAHQNILPIHDIDFTEGALMYFTMGKADGVALAELLDTQKETGALPNQIKHFHDRVRIIQQICHAISYAHSQNIVHKDIKPSNVMVGAFGEVLVVDWGTASYDLANENKSGLVGTPAYMSPEQARREKADKLSDIYCIGSTFYHLLTLHYPCWNNDLDTFWEMKKAGKYLEPSPQMRKVIPKQLLTIAEKAMAPKREDRYQSAQEMIEDLEAYQHGRSVSAYQENFLEFFARLYRNNKTTFILGVCALLAIMATGIWLYLEKNQEYGDWTPIAHTKWHDLNIEDVSNEWVIPEVSISTEDPLLEFMQGIFYLDVPEHIQEELPITFKTRISGNMQVNWSHSLANPLQQIACFIGGKDHNSAYTYRIAPQGKTTNIILEKYGKLVDQQVINRQLEPNQQYRMQMEKLADILVLSINDQSVHVYHDPEMLTGANHQQFGFLISKNSNGSLSKLNVQRQRPPEKPEAITIAHDFYSNQLYTDALALFGRIRKNYPDSEMSARALYMKGRCQSVLDNHQESLASYKHFISLNPQHQYVQHAMLYYILAHAKLGNWGDCHSSLNNFNQSITHNGIRQQLGTELHKLANIPSQDQRAIQAEFKETLNSLFPIN